MIFPFDHALKGVLFLKSDFDMLYEKYFSMIYKICFMYFKGKIADTEDAVADTFVKYLEYNGDFDSENHEKAWLIVTAQNMCKSSLRRMFRKNVNIDDIKEQLSEDFKVDEMLENIMRLPENQKMALYLHYYEGYTGSEIGKIMNVKENTVFSWLHKGRKNLEKMLGDSDL